MAIRSYWNFLHGLMITMTRRRVPSARLFIVGSSQYSTVKARKFPQLIQYENRNMNMNTMTMTMGSGGRRNYSSIRYYSSPIKNEPNLEENSSVKSSEKIGETTENNSNQNETQTASRASSFYSYTKNFTYSYEDIEKILMNRVHESNKRRFRMTLGGLVIGITWFIVAFGDRISTWIRGLTTGLALETLEDKSIKIQTQELAMAVVQTVLNDKQVTSQAAAFLREAAHTPETQEALLKLTLHVLQHPDAVKELTVLTKQVLNEISNDKNSVTQLAQLLSEVIQNQLVVSRLVQVVSELCNDPEVFAAVTDLTQKIASEPPVIEAVNELLLNSANYILKEEEISKLSRQFVEDVMRDDNLQREGGNAIWNSFYHALAPGALKITGFCVVCVSLGLSGLMLSPF